MNAAADALGRRGAKMERLVLVDLSASVCSAWRESFADHPEVSVVHGRFEDLPPTTTASWPQPTATGSWVEAAIRDRFPGVEERVRARIREHLHTYQPVGTSITPRPAMWAMLCASTLTIVPRSR
jgi:hypothetical protein